MTAAIEGNYDIVKTLVAMGADVNCQVCPLMTAAIEGNYDIVETLVAIGADVNCQASYILVFRSYASFPNTAGR